MVPMKWAAIVVLMPLTAFAAEPTDVAFETSALMRHTAYRNVARLNPESAPDGAYGPVNQAWDRTHEGNWYIEEQRYGADLVAGGIAARDTAAIDRGLLILRWGFEQQQPDGGFLCPDVFHSTSFFVEAVAHSLLLLRDSEYGDRYRAAAREMEPKLLAAARWMTKPEIEKVGREHNQPYTHRRYLVAAALGEAGTLLGDRALVERSGDYVREGIALQDAAGFNPERGGWDSSYHAVGIVFAERYYTLVADEPQRRALRAMLEKATRWEASRVDADGEVSTEGNTRVGAGRMEKGRSGKVKTVAFGSIIRAFAYWGMISGEPKWEKLAERVAVHAKMWS
jgi:hypothetical protein